MLKVPRRRFASRVVVLDDLVEWCPESLDIAQAFPRGCVSKLIHACSAAVAKPLSRLPKNTRALSEVKIANNVRKSPVHLRTSLNRAATDFWKEPVPDR